MSDFIARLSPRDQRQVERIARDGGEIFGRIDAALVEDMALALLQAHLLLIRDCGAILPARRPSPAVPPRGAYSGLHGVSLSRSASMPPNAAPCAASKILGDPAHLIAENQRKKHA